VDTEEMRDPRYAANPTNRCYFCKSELWSRLAPVAAERGLAAIVDGTNADDLSDHRPARRPRASTACVPRSRSWASPRTRSGG
jgi:uncharacterized protein